MLREKSKEEISEIWRLHHQTKDSVSAAIPADMYKQMEQRFKEFKTVRLFVIDFYLRTS